MLRAAQGGVGGISRPRGACGPAVRTAPAVGAPPRSGEPLVAAASNPDARAGDPGVVDPEEVEPRPEQTAARGDRQGRRNDRGVRQGTPDLGDTEISSVQQGKGKGKAVHG